jgi:hypothetical protein
MENIIFKPSKEVNPFLLFKLLFTKKGWIKMYKAFWK